MRRGDFEQPCTKAKARVVCQIVGNSLQGIRQFLENHMQAICHWFIGQLIRWAPPGKLTPQWNTNHLKTHLLSNMVIFHCHISFWGCNLNSFPSVVQSSLFALGFESWDFQGTWVKLIDHSTKRWCLWWHELKTRPFFRAESQTLRSLFWIF